MARKQATKRKQSLYANVLSGFSTEIDTRGCNMLQVVPSASFFLAHASVVMSSASLHKRVAHEKWRQVVKKNRQVVVNQNLPALAGAQLYVYNQKNAAPKQSVPTSGIVLRLHISIVFGIASIGG